MTSLRIGSSSPPTSSGIRTRDHGCSRRAFEGVQPGDWFYFVGDNLHGDSSPRVIRAIRIYAW
jgi:hypothetical protein